MSCPNFDYALAAYYLILPSEASSNLAKFDGKDYPVKGDPSRDMVTVKKIDDNNLEITNKKGGKVTTMIKAVYAKDGKSRVETVTGTNAQGQKVNNVTSWDKQ